MIPVYIKNWLTIIEQMNNDNTYKLAWGRAVIECVYFEDCETNSYMIANKCIKRLIKKVGLY